MRNKNIMIIFTLFIIICITVSFKLYFKYKDLKLQIDQLEKNYQELSVKTAHDNYIEARLLKLSSIEENFQWIKNIDATDKITLENYNGKTIDINGDAPLNKIILQGLCLDNKIIAPDNIINVQLHNDSRFYYMLRYYIKDSVYEVFIYDNGTIKYKDVYYESPILLSTAQSLMPIISNNSNEAQDNAISTMSKSYMATYSEYKTSDIDKSNYEQSLTELWNNAVKLRASAYYIKENMIQVDKIDDNIDNMRVLKSSGYNGGSKVDMYIFTINGGEISHVKLVYNNNVEIYKLKSTINKKLRCLPLYNIWTAD